MKIFHSDILECLLWRPPFFFIHHDCRLLRICQIAHRHVVLPNPCRPQQSHRGWQLFSVDHVPGDGLLHQRRCGGRSMDAHQRTIPIQVSRYFCVRKLFSRNIKLFSLASRTRAYATGLCAACNYIMQFVATKSYYNLELALSVPGVAVLYGFIALFGWVES